LCRGVRPGGRKMSDAQPPDLRPPPPSGAEGALDRRNAWLLFGGGFLTLLFTEKPAGFVRDESVYFSAAESHARWFKLLFSSPSTAFSDQAISQAFDFNHEHPALMKNLFGLSY